MLDSFKKLFSRKTDLQHDITIEDREIEAPQQDEAYVAHTSSSSGRTYGLPEDFWPILAKLHLDFSSNEVPKIRESIAYQEKLLEYLKSPIENKKDLTRYQTSKYKLLLQNYQQFQKAIKDPTSTSTESLEVLLGDITLTLDRRL